jgi:Uma2 family endonuclease
MAVEISRRRFTADDYQRMGQAGILSEDDRVELIDGEIVAMTPIGPRHCAAVDRTNRTMVMLAGDQAIVRVQGSVRLDHFTEPEPDLVLLRPRDDFYASAHPGPSDILLIVEVAESSLDYDRDVKGPRYARLRVPEYWLADLEDGQLSCYSRPEGGVYQKVEGFRRGQRVSPTFVPGGSIAVDDLLAVWPRAV